MAYTVETKDIKDEIKEYRKKNGLTQQEMADVIGIHRISYVNIESGRSFGKKRTHDKIMVLLNKDIIDVKIAIIDRKIKELEKEKLLLIHKE